MSINNSISYNIVSIIYNFINYITYRPPYRFIIIRSIFIKRTNMKALPVCTKPDKVTEIIIRIQ